MREHFNDMPGDIAASEAQNLPGGLGADDPDADLDATVDELVDNDVMDPDGRMFAAQDQQGGTTTGTGYSETKGDGSTVPLDDLMEGEEAA